MQREQPARDFVRSDGVPVDEVADEPAEDESSDPLLRGTAIGGGCGEGPVKILHEPDPEALSAGDVLVVRFADPGWTPLFPRAAGIVMEVGGALCHAAIVARELGIPSVFAVRGATERLEQGSGGLRG